MDSPKHRKHGGSVKTGSPQSEADWDCTVTGSRSRLRKLRKERAELLGVLEKTGKMIKKVDREILDLELHPDGFRWF